RPRRRFVIIVITGLSVIVPVPAESYNGFNPIAFCLQGLWMAQRRANLFNNDFQEPDHERFVSGGIGGLLRRRREEIQQDIEDVSRQLRIRSVYLRAIEEGRFQELPGAAYAVGFVRAYADYLGLDG